MVPELVIKSMLVKFKMLSFNQLNAQIKLNEMWKSIHIKNYPVKTQTLENQLDVMNTRARRAGLLKEQKVSCLSQRTFTNDAIHIWNMPPKSIKDCISVYSVKKRSKLLLSLCLFDKFKMSKIST